ncbi:MAG: hypothetical protein JRH20_13980 [Deltaproteobacteria bacterium]|nr:hypothetical protein [Deltaproteobacteria bacterium]
MLATTACVDERAFFVTGNASECSETAGTVNLAGGVLDVNGGYPYFFFPSVRNDLVPTQSEDGEPERNILNIEGFEVNLMMPSEFGAVDSSLTETFSYASGIVEPGGTASFTNVPILSAELVQQLSFPDNVQPVIVAKIRAQASHNGSTLKSVEYNYPIRLCRGCLIADLGDCPSTRPVGVVTNACGFPQDAPVVCCNQAVSGVKVCLDTAQLAALPLATTTP